ncbi:MAG: hypothetical protein AAF380_01935, partial [Bacteroidota bacterium]
MSYSTFIKQILLHPINFASEFLAEEPLPKAHQKKLWFFNFRLPVFLTSICFVIFALVLCFFISPIALLLLIVPLILSLELYLLLHFY